MFSQGCQKSCHGDSFPRLAEAQAEAKGLDWEDVPSIPASRAKLRELPASRTVHSL